jgi:hypothetical protein
VEETAQTARPRQVKTLVKFSSDAFTVQRISRKSINLYRALAQRARKGEEKSFKSACNGGNEKGF